MARIHIESEDEELPTLAEILKSTKPSNGERKQRSSSPSLSFRRRSPSTSTSSNSSTRENSDESVKEKAKTARPRQRVLKRVENNSVLLHPLKVSIDVSERDKKEKRRDLQTTKSWKIENDNVQRHEKECIHKTHTSKPIRACQDEYSDGASRAGFEFWSKPKPLELEQKIHAVPDTPTAARQKARSFKEPPLLDGANLSEAPNPIPTLIDSRPTSSSSMDHAALLTYEPPRRRSPHKGPPLRPSTPPQSPTKSRLTSPSKGKPQRIPTPPHQPNLDAFWSQDVINDWNDQYSPRKPITSPRKKRFATLEDSEDEGYISPSVSPRKSSPVKKDKKVIEAKKAFEASKHKTAEDFLAELDAKITNGNIADLAASTGGVKIIWSKKLNSTAGRANWKRECTRMTLSDGAAEKTYRHFASIELAEKVIDDEERLINVLAHEFCHLANFMVSGVKDNPHGREFKIWAAKVSAAFSHRDVVVTTKHSYAIDYKYVWECVACGCEFKRHSKSIDPQRHTCGSCKSKLVQTKPAVRNTKISEYQLFVKEHFQRVKRENAGGTHGAVMEALGREYREWKGKVKEDVGGAGMVDRKEMDEVVMALDVVSLDD